MLGYITLNNNIIWSNSRQSIINDETSYVKFSHLRHRRRATLTIHQAPREVEAGMTDEKYWT